MTSYRVSWEIDVEADSPREAAEKALEIQKRPDSTATVFRVLSSHENNGPYAFADFAEEIDLGLSPGYDFDANPEAYDEVAALAKPDGDPLHD